MQLTAEDLVFAKSMINVREDRREYATTMANPELMASVAQTTNAGTLNEESSEALAAAFGDLGTEFVTYKQMSVWDRMPIMLALVGLLGTEWFVRRKSGLV